MPKAGNGEGSVSKVPGADGRQHPSRRASKVHTGAFPADEQRAVGEVLCGGRRKMMVGIVEQRDSCGFRLV
jgi:hypothetical protein